jgi:hypothetical protein
MRNEALPRGEGVNQFEQQMLMARPWSAAEPGSIWSVSGEYPSQGGTFFNCIAIALPYEATSGNVLFKMVGALDDLVSPAWITSATALILVHADDPTAAYYESDQCYLGGSE